MECFGKVHKTYAMSNKYTGFLGVSFTIKPQYVKYFNKGQYDEMVYAKGYDYYYTV